MSAERCRSRSPPRSEACAGSRVKIGDRVYALGGDEVKLLPATERRNAKKELANRGVVHVKGVLPRQKVAAARELVANRLKASGVADEEMRFTGSHAGDQGRLVGAEELTAQKAFLDAVECPELFEFFEEVFGEKAVTFDNKWLRAVHPSGSSGFHMDTVYMSRGSRRLTTCWIPLEDVPLERGGLCVMPLTHTSPKYAKVRETYGALDLDRDDVGGTGWFSEDPEELLYHP
eukprot:TRINITY_DN28666_c0_g1_i1.p2 TRINITY_DN28666_c0_g1~~TRINITY_DN28666_c0_g1_i1.p2  ORF type:complete len:232 (-),score=53.26 TRINITY_DN28666_c0_g1_i1:475-1170(-)